MKNILLVFTGGTIGSTVHAGTINTDPNARLTLLHLFDQASDPTVAVNFKILQPLQILSENLHPQHWQAIIACLQAEDLSQFDGIIVTHGTDTLAFTAAALGLYFHALTIPLLLVSSDLPLVHAQANGLANFMAAVAFIQHFKLGGVFVPYKNPGQKLNIYRGVRLQSCLSLSSDFIGIQRHRFAQFDGQLFSDLEQYPPIQNESLKLKIDFSKRILLIRPYPGLDYTSFDLTQVDAVLHDLYHSGTACINADFGSQHALPAFIRRCRQQNIRIYLAPAMKNEDSYQTTQELVASGASMIWNMSLEVAYAKLLLAYTNCPHDVAIGEFLQHNLAGEIL